MFEEMCNMPLKEDMILFETNKDFQRTIWNEDIEEDIFSYTKKTLEFNFCKDKVFSKIEI